MPSLEIQNLCNSYAEEGFISGIKILGQNEALKHRNLLETAEAKVGSLHYKSKVHTILKSPYELATQSGALDIVEALLGPDILLYNVTYIVKEARSEAHVSWHQDLTYWGLSHDDQVSMWLALSPATELSGCMRMISGSHQQGRIEHHATADASNVLLQGQTVAGIDENESVLCPLAPGEASFHHGWTLHASLPNRSEDRRIGLNIQYLAAHVRQTKHDLDTAMLVRGQDRYRHFGQDHSAETDLDPAAVARQKMLEKKYIEIAGQG